MSKKRPRAEYACSCFEGTRSLKLSGYSADNDIHLYTYLFPAILRDHEAKSPNCKAVALDRVVYECFDDKGGWAGYSGIPYNEMTMVRQ